MIDDYSKRTHGRCKSCRKVWGWLGKPLLRDAHCPRCGMRLRQTQRTLTGDEWRDLPKGTKPLTEEGARTVFQDRSRDITSPKLRKDLDGLSRELTRLIGHPPRSIS